VNANRQQEIGQAIGIAIANRVDQYTVPRDITYLVLNGIDPDEAARRIIAHRRRMVGWGYVTVPSLVWIGMALGGSLFLLITGVGDLLLHSTFGPLRLIGAPVCAAIGLGWSYVLMLWALRSWRTAARGCPWEDSRNPWWPARRPRTGVGAGVEPDEGWGVPMALSVTGLLFTSGFALVPILGGVISAVEYLGRAQ
jgi:hypothetical protein